MKNVEARKESLKKFIDVLPAVFGGPGSGPNPHGGGEGDSGENKPVGTDRSGNKIHVGDKVVVKTDTSRKPFEVKITGFDPNTNWIDVKRTDTGESSKIKDWNLQKKV